MRGGPGVRSRAVRSAASGSSACRHTGGGLHTSWDTQEPVCGVDSTPFSFQLLRKVRASMEATEASGQREVGREVSETPVCSAASPTSQASPAGSLLCVCSTSESKPCVPPRRRGKVAAGHQSHLCVACALWLCRSASGTPKVPSTSIPQCTVQTELGSGAGPCWEGPGEQCWAVRWTLVMDSAVMDTESPSPGPG